MLVPQPWQVKRLFVKFEEKQRKMERSKDDEMKQKRSLNKMMLTRFKNQKNQKQMKCKACSVQLNMMEMMKSKVKMRMMTNKLKMMKVRRKSQVGCRSGYQSHLESTKRHPIQV